jgi:prepilin-type N-terminal cleavage/methylation domain-containing protein
MKRPALRAGFTLIELLVAIVIIGILAALLTPAAFRAVTRAKTAAIKVEVDAIKRGVEEYNQKYGDYPPDFSDWELVTQHYRKIFRNISETELNLLYQATHDGSGAFYPEAIDRAEALVFTLGGYSSDQEFPFTGAGGPLELIPGQDPTLIASYQYRTQRSNPLIDAMQDARRLNLIQPNLSAGLGPANKVISDDEATLGSRIGAANDIFPVLTPSGKKAPYVYFDSRTYSYTGASGPVFNLYSPDNRLGAARPYKSQIANSTWVNGMFVDTALEYVNPTTFQIISAGLDDNYGGVYPVNFPGDIVLFTYKSGRGWRPSAVTNNASEGFMAGINGYEEFRLASMTTTNVSEGRAQLDNVTDFASSDLQSDLEES